MARINDLTIANNAIEVEQIRRERIIDNNRWLEDMIELSKDHAGAINKVLQLSKKQVVSAPKGKKSIARLEQLREILKYGPKAFGELERLLKISTKEMNRMIAKIGFSVYRGILSGRRWPPECLLSLKGRVNTVNSNR